MISANDLLLFSIFCSFFYKFSILYSTLQAQNFSPYCKFEKRERRGGGGTVETNRRIETERERKSVRYRKKDNKTGIQKEKVRIIERERRKDRWIHIKID